MSSSSRGSDVALERAQELIRMRPWLGTFVEVRLAQTGGAKRADAEHAIEAGFAAVAEIHRLMSFFDPESQLSLLNRAPVGHWVQLDPGVTEVLTLARELEELSDGAFNAAASTGARSAFEVESCRARRFLEAKLDLGGIAKGYAVDSAVEAIQRLVPEAQGVVNAGGDLRVFGEKETQIHLRAESESGPMLYAVSLANAAVATSSRMKGGRPASFSVMAGRCFWADALTKVAAGASSRCLLDRCLERFGAQAFSFGSDGRPVEAA